MGQVIKSCHACVKYGRCRAAIFWRVQTFFIRYCISSNYAVCSAPRSSRAAAALGGEGGDRIIDESKAVNENVPLGVSGW